MHSLAFSHRVNNFLQPVFIRHFIPAFIEFHYYIFFQFLFISSRSDIYLQRSRKKGIYFRSASGLHYFDFSCCSVGDFLVFVFLVIPVLFSSVGYSFITYILVYLFIYLCLNFFGLFFLLHRVYLLFSLFFSSQIFLSLWLIADPKYLNKSYFLLYLLCFLAL